MWIEWKWTEDKPYPETLDTQLSMVRFADGDEDPTSYNVGWWYGTGSPSTSNWYQADGSPASIVAYKVVES